LPTGARDGIVILVDRGDDDDSAYPPRPLYARDSAQKERLLQERFHGGVGEGREVGRGD
jgi:hypothetical protein